MSRSRNSSKGCRGRSKRGCPERDCDWCMSRRKREFELQDSRKRVEITSVDR